MGVLHDVPETIVYISVGIVVLLAFWLGRCSKSCKKEEPQHIHKRLPPARPAVSRPYSHLEPIPAPYSHLEPIPAPYSHLEPIPALIPTPRVNQLPNVNNTCVFFFPDKNEPCETYYSSFSHSTTSGNLSAIKKCKNRKYCKRMHLEDKQSSSMIRILEVLRPASKIYMCMYNFTLNGACKVLIQLNQRQVDIRIIADKSLEVNENSCIKKLKAAGIEVREMFNEPNLTEKERPKMHNKFVVVDERVCLLGSFNWTWLALNKHEESVIKTDHELVVKQLVQRFEMLWDRFSPEKRQLFDERTSRPQRQPNQQLKPTARAKLPRGRSQ